MSTHVCWYWRWRIAARSTVELTGEQLGSLESPAIPAKAGIHLILVPALPGTTRVVTVILRLVLCAVALTFRSAPAGLKAGATLI